MELLVDMIPTYWREWISDLAWRSHRLGKEGGQSLGAPSRVEALTELIIL